LIRFLNVALLASWRFAPLGEKNVTSLFVFEGSSEILDP